MAKVAKPGYYGKSPSLLLIVVSRAAALLQLFAAIALLIPVVYFAKELQFHEYSVPESFYFLGAVAAVTIIVVTISSLLSCLRKLRPLWSLILNALLAALWTASLAVVFAKLRHVVFGECSVDAWSNAAGVWLCYLYRVLFVGPTVGFVSSIAALIVDVVCYRRQQPKIKYTMAQTAGLENDQEVLVSRAGNDGEPLYDDADAWPRRPQMTAQSQSPSGAPRLWVPPN